MQQDQNLKDLRNLDIMTPGNKIPSIYSRPGIIRNSYIDLSHVYNFLVQHTAEKYTCFYNLQTKLYLHNVQWQKNFGLILCFYPNLIGPLTDIANIFPISRR